MKNKQNYIIEIAKISLYLIFYTLVLLIFVLLSNIKNTDKNILVSHSFSKSPVIIIDAGHGGYDGGATGTSGVPEKEINLKIAKYLSSYFMLSEIDCIMTRNDDCELIYEGNQSLTRKRSDLLARVKIANANENSCFISIHQNKFPSSRYSGLQVFYSKNDINSRVLAERIKNNNVLMIDKNNKREIKPAGKEIYLLDKIECPAVLVECGFLSNAKEEELLISEEYQKKVAFMLYCSIIDYITENNLKSEGSI